MKPSRIADVLDLARRVVGMGGTFNPLFVGPPGVGKSQIVQQWCKANKLPFIDLRAAYLEAPDLIGFPSIVLKDGRSITQHNAPEFLPVNGEGVLLLEEPNRGTTAVMNTFMQLLTDKKIHTYEFPEKWMIVACINPENVENDVNAMDSALKNRFTFFDVGYDKGAFLDYMKKADFDQSIQLFVESGAWSFVLPEKVSDQPGASYISPRTFSVLNAILKAGISNKEGVDSEMQRVLFESILGANTGKSFYQFYHGDQPVLYEDLIADQKMSLKRLKKFSDPSDPNGHKLGHISVTIRDIVEKNLIEDDLLAAVVVSIPADQGPTLIRDLEFKRKDTTILDRIMKNYPAVHKYLKDTLSTK